MSKAVTFAPIGSLVTITGGGTPSKSRAEYYQGTIPWVTPKDMKSWEITDAEDHITQEAITNSATKLIQPHHVLVVIRSGILKRVLPVAINHVPVAINQDMKALRCEPSLHPDYLARALQWSAPRILGTVRATTADNIPLDVIRRLTIPVPSLDDQRRIAAILDQADAVRRKRQQAIQLTDDLLRSAFLDMFGDPAASSKGWPSDQLGNRISFLTSGSRGWAKYYSDSGCLFLRIQNVGHNRLLLDDVAYVHPPEGAESQRTLVQPGDVLLSITADLGRTAVVPEDLGPTHINQHLALLRPSNLEPLYLSAFLASEAGRAQLLRRNRQGVKAGLNFDDVRSVSIPIPPAGLQRSFFQLHRRTERLRAEFEAIVLQEEQLHSSLVQRAFRGGLGSKEGPPDGGDI